MNSSETTDEQGSEKLDPIPFSGAIDSAVVLDLQAVFKGRALAAKLIMLVAGLSGATMGVWGAWTMFAAGNASSGIDFILTLAYSAILLAVAFEARKGWARRLTGQEVSGRLQSAGVVVDQLDDRATWHEFDSVWIGESAALLFISDTPRPPRTLALDGFPLHASFFESEEAWRSATQLIRERIRTTRMVGLS